VRIVLECLAVGVSTCRSTIIIISSITMYRPTPECRPEMSCKLEDRVYIDPCCDWQPNRSQVALG